jgi:MerR family transcriptional regulator, light-induced transcriptional regulator
MKSYQIAELEQLSGIKAHTIRIWEKRYNLIEPDRTDTNIRRYNDKQVRKLLNVSTLLAGGLKISKIALLKERELHEKIKELQSRDNQDSISTSFINELIVSMLSFNEVSFEKTFSAAVIRFGMFEAMLRVFYPFLLKTGMMWIVESAMPAQEHFASSIIRRKLMASIDGLPAATKSRKKFLLLLPPQEWHDTGLLFSNYIIRSKGFETIYLGQDVPYENIALVLKHCKPSYILSFYIARKNPEELSGLRKKMNLPKETTFLVAGNLEMTDIIKHEKNTQILKSPNDLLKFL